jgi:hypothetical protein
MMSNSPRGSNSISIKLRLDFPSEVDLAGIEHKEYGVNHLHDFQEIFTDYNRVSRRNGYYPLDEKARGYRWMFFLDTYELYKDKDKELLELNSVFGQKWYKGKYMTIVFLDKNFEFHKRVIPATKQEYQEEKKLFDELYCIFKENQHKIGGFIKREAKDEIVKVYSGRIGSVME